MRGRQHRVSGAITGPLAKSARSGAPSFAVRLGAGARDHQCDVILLFATAAELLDRLNHRLQKRFYWKVRLALQGGEQTGCPKLLTVRVLGLGDSIGVEYQCITWSKLDLR